MNHASKRYEIVIYTGIAFDLGDPRPENVHVEDIAHALAYMCRFNGHCEPFYSVAAHSLYVSELLAQRGYSPEIQFQGLFHDADEAYTNDPTTPWKRLLSDRLGQQYNKLTEPIWFAIADRFGMSRIRHPAIKEADTDAYRRERYELFVPEAAALARQIDNVAATERHGLASYPDLPLQRASKSVMERRFLQRYESLALQVGVS